jgi:hypothetical protein
MGRRLLTLILVCSTVFFVPGCGHDQQLVSINIEPTTQSFGDANTPVDQDAGASAQLRAIGNYIHPPVSKDITTQVTWASNTPGLVTVNASGVVTATGQACGSSLISATVQTNTSAGGITSNGAIVTGTMTASVVCFSGVTLTVDFSGNGSGTVVSSPAGVSCSTSCSGGFTSGADVTLTATPNPGSSFGGWGGCDSVSGQICTLNNLKSDSAVTVIFN